MATEGQVTITLLLRDMAQRGLLNFEQNTRRSFNGLTGDAKKFSVSMRELSKDVELATSDFRTGMLSADGYRTALQNAKQGAMALRLQGFAPAGKDLTAFNSVMAATPPIAQGAGRGMVTVRNVMAQLGAQAVGVRGIWGTLFSSLAQFSTGTLASVGITAGLLGLVAVWRQIGGAAREAREEFKKAREEEAKARREKTGVVQAELSTKLQARQKEIDEQLAAARARADKLEREAGTDETFAPSSDLVMLNKQILALEKERAVNRLALENVLDGFRERAAESRSDEQKAREQEIADLQEALRTRNLTMANVLRIIALEKELTKELEKQKTLHDRMRAARQLRDVTNMRFTVTEPGQFAVATTMGRHLDTRTGPAPEHGEGPKFTDQPFTGGDGMKFADLFRDAIGPAKEFRAVIVDIAAQMTIGFGGAVESAFSAFVTGSQSASKAFRDGMLRAIADIARQKGQMYLLEAVAEIGAAFAHPASAGLHLKAAAQYAAAGAGLMALAGVAGGIAAGGGAAGAAGAYERTNAYQGAAENLGGTLVIEGSPFLDMSDPRQRRALEEALKRLGKVRAINYEPAR